MIPDEAIADASLVYWRNLEDVGHKAALRKALEAAAPHMLSEAYDLGFRHGSNEPTSPYRSQA